jgi:fido (protein-threonine AMPylation protein)
MNCEDLNHYFSTRFEQIQFENIQDENLYIENISSAKVKYQKNYSELSEILISDYIREIWISEFPSLCQEIDTVAITDDLILGNSKPNTIDDRLWKKLNNIHIALINILSDETLSIEKILSEKYIHYLHSIIGDEIIEDAGNYRTVRVRANASSVIYASPGIIKFRIEKLFQFILKKYNESVDLISIDKMGFIIKLGSFLFSEFLLIHPYKNGNGRTARLLINAFFKISGLIVPFSLYYNRDAYILSLEKRSDLSPPSALATFILLACNRTASQINWLCLE